MEGVRDAGLTTLAAARDAIAHWNTGAMLTDPRAVADHLEAHVEPMTAALDIFHTEVSDELTRREDLWRPLVDDLRAWLPLGRAQSRHRRR